ncbi:MAG: putative toxin-antitoxin system antitoxin component (TIGR02293 family) [Akkermansiaceae bacterium]|jgi:putative toxin-antitoxin system antitoxin component (TIGR02293 family)
MKHTDQPLTHFFLPRESLDGAPSEIVERIRDGIQFREFSTLQALLEIPEEALGRYLGMSNATLHRRKKARRLSSAESERLVRFTRLFGIALGVFGTEAAACSWLKTENPATAGEAPLSYADTEFGAREVENLLGRIDHGVF